MNLSACVWALTVLAFPPTPRCYSTSSDLLAQELDAADIQDKTVDVKTCNRYANNMKVALQTVLRKANRYRHEQDSVASDLSGLEQHLLDLDRQRSRLKKSVRNLEAERARIEELATAGFNIAPSSKEARALVALQSKLGKKRDKVCARLTELEGSHQGVSFSDFMHVVRFFDAFGDAGGGSGSVSGGRAEVRGGAVCGCAAA